MDFPEFAMERLQSTWEKKVRYDLSESGLEALTLEEAAPDVDALRAVPLGYAEGTGREATRALVAAFHPGASTEHVLVTTGTSEANFLMLATLLSPGDEVVVVMPNYMQVHGIARGLGAKVREVWLQEEHGWHIDLDSVRSAIGPRTKLVCVCQPNNPTGQLLTRAEVIAVAKLAALHGAWILSDEVYRGAERSGEESQSFWGMGEQVLVTGGLSKVYGLPGLRIGWVVAPPERIATALRLKDYTTIAPATLSELLAEHALARRDQLVTRARFLLNERWPMLEEWAVGHGRDLGWTAPAAGAICFFSYRFPIDSVPLAERLAADWSTLVTPGAHLGAERHLRIGFGMAPRVLRAGLAALDRLLATL